MLQEVWVTPGLGFEPKCSKGTTGLEPAALVRSATPAVCGVLAQGVVLRRRLYLMYMVQMDIPSNSGAACACTVWNRTTETVCRCAWGGDQRICNARTHRYRCHISRIRARCDHNVSGLSRYQECHESLEASLSISPVLAPLGSARPCVFFITCPTR